MAGVNKVILVGNVGADPEMKQVGDSSLASIRLATSKSWKDKSTGERKERTEWHRLKVWGRQAEIVEQYVRKGSKLYVEGEIETSTYEKNGETRYSTEIRVWDFQMLDGRNDGDAPRQQQQPQRAAAPAPDDDDIPF